MYLFYRYNYEGAAIKPRHLLSSETRDQAWGFAAEGGGLQRTGEAECLGESRWSNACVLKISISASMSKSRSTSISVCRSIEVSVSMFIDISTYFYS